jgi:hypothetical protein
MGYARPSEFSQGMSARTVPSDKVAEDEKECDGVDVTLAE